MNRWRGTGARVRASWRGLVDGAQLGYRRRAVEDDDGLPFCTSFNIRGSGCSPAASPAPEHRKGELRFTPPAGPVAEGDTGTYTVRLSRKPTAEVTVTLTQPTNTDVTVDTAPSTGGNQDTLTFTPSNWDTPQPVTVLVAEDDDTGHLRREAEHPSASA